MHRTVTSPISELHAESAAEAGRKHIAIVGAGAAGLAAAWSLARTHRVTLVEADDRLGGHANTEILDSHEGLAIDTGFIVYNEPCYPNFTRWMQALGVRTQASDMSFAVSRDNGSFEYAGGPALGLIAQPGLLLRPRFWRMLRDLVRFYREAPGSIPAEADITLGQYLARHGYSREFMEDHLMPFAAAVWSAPCDSMLGYPAAAFIRFCDNHGLLKLTGRPQWRTVSGGSQTYVKAVRSFVSNNGGEIRTGFPVASVVRNPDGVVVRSSGGDVLEADAVVMAMHADQALACLDAPDPLEQELLDVFSYEPNLAVLHTDTSHLPRRRRAWCSWNYVERDGTDTSQVSVSYWMNRLQNLQGEDDFIVSLNPDQMPSDQHVLRTSRYQHPVFTVETWRAQQRLWELQGRQRTYYCGSYFGAGFHEDAVQAGLAAADAAGAHARPWQLDNPSSRIVVSAGNHSSQTVQAA
jgi:predicted NAD/FAD-binding protein